MSHHLSLASGPSFNPPASIGLVRAGPRIRTVASLVSGRGQDARRGRAAVVTVLTIGAVSSGHLHQLVIWEGRCTTSLSSVCFSGERERGKVSLGLKANHTLSFPRQTPVPARGPVCAHVLAFTTISEPSGHRIC